MENENITPVMEDENLLDGIVIDEGTELNESNVQMVTGFTATDVAPQLAYDDFGPMPGEKIEILQPEVTEDDAEKKLIEMAAMMKLQKEKEEFNKMSDDAKIKDYIFKTQYYKNTNDFYHKYGYEMSGKQKRNLKRDIERAWNKGKYKLTAEQKQEILYELNKASNANPNQDGNNNSAETKTNHISDLNSLIFN